MKAIYKHIAFAALALSAAACSQDDDFAPSYLSDPDAVRITAQVGAADVTGGFTRSNPLGTAEEQAQFNTGDQISVTADTQAPVTYQLGTDGWKPVGEAYLKWQTNEMNVTAYYPVGKNNASATTFTVPTEYTDLVAIAEADYMTYSGTQSKGDDRSINLEMQRKMVRLVITPEFNDQFATGCSVTTIKVHANTKGFADGEPETGNIIVTALKQDDAFYALLAPTTEATAATFLTVTVSDGTTSQDLTVKGIPATTAGNSYSFALTVGKDKAAIGSVSVKDWTGATIEGGEATEVISYKYDEASNTYTVYNANGLYAWNEKVQAIFATGVFNYEIGTYEYEEDFPNLTLAADITLKGENNWTPFGGMDKNGWEMFYIGTINGDGHTITGLRINSDSIYQGFIGLLGEGGTVKNLTFTDAVVSAGQYSGIVVGSSNGTIENCHVTSGSLTTTYKSAGGIVGLNGSMVIDCTNAATIAVAQGVTNANNLGGIAGNNSSTGIIMGCINTGAISSGNLNIGGVLGDNDGIVVACSNKGTVTGSSQTGGIVGRNAQSFAQTIGLWTIVTTESDEDGNGIGLSYSTVTSCFTGNAATINAKVSEMNEAIAAYNSSAAEGKTCPYTWQAGTDGYPTLVKSE